MSRHTWWIVSIVLALGLGAAAFVVLRVAPAFAQRSAEPTHELVVRVADESAATPELCAQIAEILCARAQACGASASFELREPAQIALRVACTDGAEQLATLRESIECVGALSFEAVVDAQTPGVDFAAERARLQAWREGHPFATPEQFDELATAEGGPGAAIRWRAQRADEAVEWIACEAERQRVPAERFHGDDLAKVTAEADDTGFPAIGFEFSAERRRDFARFTEGRLDRQLAVVLDGEVVTAPVVVAPLTGASIIAGRFTASERDAILAALRSGELPERVVLVEQRELTHER